MSAECHAWLEHPDPRYPSSDEIHVWWVSLQLPAADLHTLAQTLAPDEHARVSRLYFARDRRRFIAGRGLLRTILSRYLGAAPGQLQLCYGPRGKPALATPGGSRLRFNLSHSHDLALLAVTRYREIGVDLEYVRPSAAGDQIAARYFSLKEQEQLQGLPAHEKLMGFWNCWTRKEAFIKACGDGLFRSLDQFDVSLAPGAPAQLLFVRGDPSATDRWSLHALPAPRGYVAAIAVEGRDWRLTTRHLPARLEPAHGTDGEPAGLHTRPAGA